MSPLAHRIYQRLRSHLRARPDHPLTYGDLARALRVRVRSAPFYAALGEVTDACRARALPTLAALVGRHDTRRPGDGYYKIAHPRVRSEAGRKKAWVRERALVAAAAARFPEAL
jgi:hypothetical protein